MQGEEFKSREQYTIFRRRNKVRLMDVAGYIGCSISLLSKWERELINISDEKASLYNEFIETFKVKESIV